MITPAASLALNSPLANSSRARGPEAALRFIQCTPALLSLAHAMDRDALGRKYSNIISAFLAPNLAWAVVDGGELLGCGGVVPVWHGRAEAWLTVTTLARRRDIVRGLRLASSWFDRLQEHAVFRRLEITVRADMAYAHTMARALGFGAPEAVMRGWAPDGTDGLLFARVKNG